MIDRVLSMAENEDEGLRVVFRILERVFISGMLIKRLYYSVPPINTLLEQPISSVLSGSGL